MNRPRGWWFESGGEEWDLKELVNTTRILLLCCNFIDFFACKSPPPPHTHTQTSSGDHWWRVLPISQIPHINQNTCVVDYLCIRHTHDMDHPIYKNRKSLHYAIHLAEGKNTTYIYVISSWFSSTLFVTVFLTLSCAVWVIRVGSVAKRVCPPNFYLQGQIQ